MADLNIIQTMLIKKSEQVFENDYVIDIQDVLNMIEKYSQSVSKKDFEKEVIYMSYENENILEVFELAEMPVTDNEKMNEIDKYMIEKWYHNYREEYKKDLTQDDKTRIFVIES